MLTAAPSKNVPKMLRPKSMPKLLKPTAVVPTTTTTTTTATTTTTTNWYYYDYDNECGYDDGYDYDYYN